MADIHLGGGEPPLKITAHFTHETEASTLANGWPLIPKYTVPGQNEVSYAIRPAENAKPARLWITGTEIGFTAKVVNEEPQRSLDDWKVGFIQTIYRSERNGHYAGGVERRMKLDTSFGPLTDGWSAPFYGPPEAFTGQSVDLYEDDAPNFQLPLAFGPNTSMLEGTSGQDEFSTYLALARESDKTIITLGAIAWTVDWTGVYQHGATQPWRPTGPEGFFNVRPRHEVAVYSKLNRNPKHVPFSLRMCEAEAFSKILQNGSWLKCNMSGDTTKGESSHLRSWRTQDHTVE